jgi:hypothetical protein
MFDNATVYVGTKTLKAVPQTRAQYCRVRGWEVPADENGADEGYMVQYADGYISWSPTKQFEEAYTPAEEGFDFGSAVRLLKQGHAVHREGWNGKGMFLYHVGADSYPAKTDIAKREFGDEALVPYRAYIAMKTAQGDVVPWVASQSDVLAVDWQLA